MRKSFTRILSLLFVFCLVSISTFVKAQEAQKTVELYAEDVSACYNASNDYVVKISMRDFISLVRFHLVLDYSEGVLNFKSATGWNANIGSTTVVDNAVAGTLTFDWTSATPVTFADNLKTDVVTLHFGLDNFPNNLALSYVSPLTWTTNDFFYKLPSSVNEVVNTAAITNGKLTATVGITGVQVSVGTVTCAGGDAVGTVTAPAQGTGYTYLFNEDGNPANWTWTANASYSAPSNTTNTVRVKDANGCISLPQAFAIANLAPVTYTASKQDATCKGGNGELQINAVGGTGPYTYWVIPEANFAAVQPTLVSNLAKQNASADYKKINFQILRAAGTYHVAVDDVNMCRDLSNAAYWTTLTISEPATAVVVTPSAITGESCAGSANGSFAISVAGGTAAGEYKVSLDGGLTWATTVSQAYTFTNLAAKTYYVTAMDDNGCKTTSAAIVVAPKAPITFALSIVDTSCGGDNDGQIAVSSIAGGTGPYTLVIKDATTTTTQAAVASAYTFTGLSPHYYSLTITDANNCTASYINPNGTGNVIAVQSPADIAFTVAQVNVPCNGGNGTLTVTATGGTGSYLYGLNGVYATPNTNVFSVPVGTYDVSVKNASGTGCEVTQSEIIVTEPEVLTASIDHVLPPTCIDGSDGNIYVNIVGGTPTYYYSINNGSWVEANSSMAIIKATVGTHTINIKDANGCSIETPLTQTVTQNEDLITATPSKVITCFGTTDDAVINVSVDSWATDLMPVIPNETMGAMGRTIQFKYSNSEATANTGTGFTPGVTHFAAGIYWIGAVDEYGCMATPVKVEVLQNPELVISSVVANGASCYGTFGGTITIQATGGTLLSNQKLQYALLNDQAGLDNISSDKWLDFQTYDSETMLSTVSFQVEKGTYWIAVKDGNCVNNFKTYGPITVDGYDKLTIKESSVIATNLSCNGDLSGIINVPMTAVSGGAGAYMFTLLNSSGVPITNRIQQATGVFGGLAAGTYSVKVEDSEGCPSYTTAQITLTEPVVLSFTVQKSYFTCNASNDGVIKITVSGGTAPYKFAVNNQNVWFPVNDTPNTKTYIATEPGIHNVWVKDAHGCVTSVTVVDILQPDVISPSISVVQNVLCNGSATGRITVSATGGWDEMSVFNYKVDDGVWGNAASIAALTLNAGVHTLYVKDVYASYANPYVNPTSACVYSKSFTITEPKAISYTVAISHVKCYGSSDGTFTVNVDGTTGTPWTGNLNDALNGYQVQLTGDNYNVTARTGSDNSITFTGLPHSFYTVFITDSNGCTLKPTVGSSVSPWTTVESWEVAQPASPLTISGEWKKDATCFGSTDGQFVINAAGGSESYKYYAALSIEPDGHILTTAPPVEGSSLWQDSNVFNVKAGTWVIWTIDSNGCMVGGETKNGVPYNPWRVKIAQPAEITWAFHMMHASPVDTIHYKMPSCFGKEDGQIHLINVTGGTGTYTAVATGTSADGVAKVYTQVITKNASAPYLWVINNVAASDANGYAVKVIDSNECETATKTVVIKQPKLLTVTLAKGDDQFTCPDAVEGFIEASAMGGTKPYTYSLYKDGDLHTADVTPAAFLVQIGHTFMVVVKDANGCTATSSITINPVLPIEAKIAETTCYGDPTASVIVSATGEPDRTFSVRYRLNTSSAYTDWMPLNSNNEIALSGFIFANNTPTQNFYYFQLMDSKGCKTEDIDYSFVPTQHPLEATVVQSEDQLSASLTITGGVSPYSYKVGDADMVNLPVDGNTFQVVKLQAPQTVVVVYDAHMCMVSKPIVVDPVSVTAVPGLGNNMENTFSVVLTFNRIVTVPDGAITVTGGEGTVTGSGKVYTVAITAEDLADVKIELANTIVDAAGNMLAAKTFTYKVGDHVAPTVVVTDPATPVATFFSVGLKFSEPVSGVLGAVTVTGGTLADVTGMGDTYTIKVSATEQTAVTIVIDNTISDLSANANKFAGLTLNYTTGDFTAPTLVTMAPSDGETTTDNHPTFTMTFSEDVMVGAGGSLTVYKVNTTTAAMPAIPITADMISGKNVTVSYPATQSGLDKDTRYYVLVDGTAIEDKAGNAFVGVSDVAAWTFKTGPEFATVVPTVNGSLEFKVYPNPFVDYVTVSNASKLAKVVVTNIAGQVVKEVVNPTDRIQLNELRSGVYFISMYTSNTVIAQTAKIVKR